MGTTLREHQKIMYDMLCEFDGICRRHAIPYILFAGSALGAVRHKGFIPWDDDLDVLLLRPDYDRFLAAAGKELSGSLFLQKEFSEHWPVFFSKIRKNGTACMEKAVPKDRMQHQGIYIDVFPCDNLSDNGFVRKIQFFASKIVIAKSLDKRGYLTDSRLKKIFMSFCRLLPLKPFLSIAKNKKAGDSKMVNTFFAASSAYKKSIFKREWITDTELIRFEDGEFPVSRHYDEMLTTLYGDYMKVPTESERACKIHALKVDAEHPYTEYLDWQAEQKIDVYTRSIR